MSRLLSIGASSLVSGSVMGNGSLTEYIGSAARKTLGMGLSEFSDGGVQYFSKDYEILKRAAIQASSQLAYGVLKNLFFGYITAYNSESQFEIKCENMAYKLKC